MVHFPYVYSGGVLLHASRNGVCCKCDRCYSFRPRDSNTWFPGRKTFSKSGWTVLFGVERSILLRRQRFNRDEICFVWFCPIQTQKRYETLPIHFSEIKRRHKVRLGGTRNVSFVVSRGSEPVGSSNTLPPKRVLWKSKSITWTRVNAGKPPGDMAVGNS